MNDKKNSILSAFVDWEKQSQIKKQFAKQQITHLNSKPKQFSQVQKQQINSLKQELTELKNHLQELEANPNLTPKLDLTPEDEQEIAENKHLNEEGKQKLKRTWPITKRINELDKQVNLIVIQIYRPNTDGKLLEHWTRILNHELTEEQKKKIAEQADIGEWCCKDCQWKLLNDGERGCVGCQCSCHQETKDWIKYKNSLSKEEKAKITELIFKPNQFKFKNNKLRINEKEFPNLKTVYACGLDLKKVRLNHSKLENLYLTDNKLSQINLDNVPNLKNILVNKNKLESLRVQHLKHLEDLRCNGNLLNELKISGLANLRVVDASGNCRISEDADLKLWLDGCVNLSRLDIAEASPKIMTSLDNDKISFPYLPALKMISFKLSFVSSNFSEKFGETIELNSPKLKFLDYYGTNINEVIHKSGLKNPEQLRIFNDEECENIDLSSDAATEWEDLFNKYVLEEEREKQGIESPDKECFSSDETKENEEEVITNPDSLTINSYYSKLKKKSGQKEYLDISHMNLMETLIIDGWPNLQELNVGDNYLEYLLVKNCPHLTTLRYAHNAMKHDAWYKDSEGFNNPKLTIVDNHNWDGRLDRGYSQDETEQSKGKEKFNQELEEEQKPNQPEEEEISESKQNIASSNKNYWLLIIGCIAIFPLILGIFVLLAKKWIERDSQKSKQV
ncbi:MAG: hypothetical protein GBAus27B_000459 [Mycoplasmataceae bacterium]|nr:MAG: hypothetical protein GBAus27B_000459 [Mycoplasmataceae bacterium]